MLQPDFAYSPAEATPTHRPVVSIFVDRAPLRDLLREDAVAAGLEVRECGPLARALEGDPRPVGEVILCDVPQPAAAGLAALARLDMRAARSGARLIVSTTVGALEAVFACCDQSDPQILVDPSRAERVVALGRVLADAGPGRVRELTGHDRLALLRLTEQVDRIAERLERFDAFSPGPHLASPATAYNAADSGNGRIARAEPPALPEPRVVRRIIRQRQLRARFFDGDLFADPAWDMLLDLAAARGEQARVSITSLCIASGVPPTTALRWIGVMTDAGLLERTEDTLDRRRAFIALTDKAASAMAAYFAGVADTAPVL